MSFQQKTYSLTSVAFVFLLLLFSCAPAPNLPAITFTPSSIPTTTATPLPTLTATPIPIPENLLAQKDLLEKNGFIFGEGEITYQDKRGKVWEVVKFNSDGSAVIKGLDNYHKATEQILLPQDQLNNLELIPIAKDAGISYAFTETKEDGGVERFFNPEINPDFQMDAGWQDFIDISLDPHNPSILKSLDEQYSGQVLLSALLKNENAPWPDDKVPAEFWIHAERIDQPNYPGDIVMWTSWAGHNGRIVSKDPSSSRFLGYTEFSTPHGIIKSSIIQNKINDAGESITLSLGYSGDFLDFSYTDNKSNTKKNYVTDLAFTTDSGPYNPMWGIMIYYELPDGKGGMFMTFHFMSFNMEAVQYLQEQDPHNQAWKLFPDELQVLKDAGDEWHQVPNETVKKMQFMILMPAPFY